MLSLRNTEIFLTRSGKGRPLLCLHGWGRGVDGDVFIALREALRDDAIEVITLDLPGFGKSGEPPKAWTVDDYADCIEELVENLQLQDVFLLGHSFGGRIVIKLAARASSSGRPCHPERSEPKASVDEGSVGRPSAQHDSSNPWLSHLFLCAAAGVGRDLHIRRKFWLMIAKIGNAVFLLPGISALKPFARKVLYKLLRVRDYEQASERMRETMKAVINEDLTPLLSKITVPTDLFWGTEDTLTPLKDGQLMNTKIVQSKLHIFPGVRHAVHRERAKEIAEVIRWSV